MDIENSLRRSKVETNRYECKQGFVTLSPKIRKIDKGLYQTIINTICGMANLGPDSEGYIFIGVCDKEADKNTIEKLDKITSIKAGGRYIVGVDREVSFFNNSLEEYVKAIINAIDNSKLTPTLKNQVLTQIDNVDYGGLSIIKIKVPSQKSPSFVDTKCYTRKDSTTREVTGTDIVDIVKLFS